MQLLALIFKNNKVATLKMSEYSDNISAQQTNDELQIQTIGNRKAIYNQNAYINELKQYKWAIKIQYMKDKLQMENFANSVSNQIKRMRSYKQSLHSQRQLNEQFEKKIFEEKNKLRKALKFAETELTSKRKQEQAAKEQLKVLGNQKKQLKQQEDILTAKLKNTILKNEVIGEKIDEKLKKKEDVDRVLQESYILKKKLNNDLQELRGNIRVYCRVRPFLHIDHQNPTYEVINDNLLKLHVPKEFQKSGNHLPFHSYNFEQIFDVNNSQEDIFAELMQLIQSAVDGKKVCIFAYGQTGSGKTYTMQGGETIQEKGIIPRSIDIIFDEVERAKKYKWEYEIGVSIQEVYLDHVRNLIGDTDDETARIPVNNAEEVMNYLEIAGKNRKVAETNCNEHSSRSHLIFTIHIRAESTDKFNQVRTGSLNLVDLAGSERVGESGVVGDRMKETQAINKSLTQLGVVITAMGRKEHIPFRSSKLTHLLQPYLQNESKTLMFVNISPKIADFNQTLCSLRFAEKVKECKITK